MRPRGSAVVTTAGFLPHPWHAYWESMTPVESDEVAPPLLFLTGSNQSGAAYRVSLDDGPSWVEHFLGAGRECWVMDWPGVGRSGLVPLEALDFAFTIDAASALLDVIGRPVDLVVHSMSGLVAWKLLERDDGRLARVVALAPSPPVELMPPVQVVSDDGRVLRAVFGPLTFAVDRKSWFIPDDAYVERQAIGTGTRVSGACAEHFKRTLQPIPPRMLLQRLNVPGTTDVLRLHGPLADVPVLVLTGTADSAHPREVDEATARYVADCGARAEFVYLGDLGIEGNGHLLMLEDNSTDLARIVETWLSTGRLAEAMTVSAQTQRRPA